MIGVIANPSEEYAAREFFELFKTPWEFYRDGGRYEVVLCAGEAKLEGLEAKVLLTYAGRKTGWDEGRRIQIHSERRGANLSFRGNSFPIYGNSVTFQHAGAAALQERESGEPAAFVDRRGERVFARVGYDLFGEIHLLLTQGQPAANAGIPTLELHIAFLRDLINGCGIPIVEIPPVPDGHPFVACLTHDVDHASIRRHKFDPTMFGFLYRATLGSVVRASRGHLPLRKLFTNWAAAARLPLTYLGLAGDFWMEFDRYLEIEKGHPSTFFVIPFEGTPGRSAEGAAPRARASGYDVSHIAGKLPRLLSAGCEIGLHGIDAWIDSSKGREEARRITGFSGTADVGVRMHWLFWSEKSPAVLEEAGFSYDSTVGYNETVGYRAGTSQAFKPQNAIRMLELPLHIMDTALFYPDHLDLSPSEAWEQITPLLNNSRRLGGVLTINWHDRSIAPERLWGDFYARLLAELETTGPWFATAQQAVSWFQMRRSAVFESVDWKDGKLRVKVSTDGAAGLPGLRLRFHRAQMSPKPAAASADNFVDKSLKSSVDVHFSN